MKFAKKCIDFFNSNFRYITLGFIVIYMIAAISVSLNRYWQYQTFYFDLGIFDSAIWKVSRFQLPIVDHIHFGIEEKIIFADHFNPSIFLLSPLYWLTQRREILLIAQTLAVGGASYVAFVLATEHLKSKLAIFSLIVAFLGYVGMQNGLISDFHGTTVAVFPLMLLFWAAFKKKWRLYFLFLVIVLGFKESFAGLGVALGLFLFIRDKKTWKMALATITLSLVWGILTIKYIIPYFADGTYFFTPSELPENLKEFIAVFLFPKSKWQTIFYTYLTFGFLPVFDLSILPAVFENFFERFVLSTYKGRDLGLHYNTPLSPLMFMGSLYVFGLMEKSRKLKKVVPLYAILILSLVIFLHRFILRGPLALAYNPVFYEQNRRVRYVDDFLTQVPKEGVIMTQNDLAVRFTHEHVKLLRENYWLINPDQIVLNLTPGQNPNSFSPLSFERAKLLKDNLMNDTNYTLKKFGEELYLFSKIEK